MRQGNHFSDEAQEKIEAFCRIFGVSRTAALIRLEQLDYLQNEAGYKAGIIPEVKP